MGYAPIDPLPANAYSVVRLAACAANVGNSATAAEVTNILVAGITAFPKPSDLLWKADEPDTYSEAHDNKMGIVWFSATITRT
jgi:hypothetical protein